MAKARITWNGEGGELDSIVVVNDGEQALTFALIHLIRDTIVAVGDTFVVEEIAE